MFKTLIALWRIIKWLRQQKSEMEADVDGYLTQERALAWRLNAEKIFHILEDGTLFASRNVAVEGIPKPIQWLFNATTVDNRVGEFGLYLLKSTKLGKDDPILNEPIKPYRVH